ncbi:arsenate reductase (glutaredoxin) [Kiloniella litopenaei]|uniref:arsenate reductase (glutaredoxin) n=1 Tax=Kiloniella litopenaei TaxID=1549748 RepID=UPI003BA8CAD7
MTITIHHNPECGTSRNVLNIIRQFYGEPKIVEYLKTGWQREQLNDLLNKSSLTPRQALRTTKSPAKELGLLDPTVSETSIFEAMLEYPILVNRPIVCTDKGTLLCRPSETVFSLINVPSGATFTKEDGEVIIAS